MPGATTFQLPATERWQTIVWPFVGEQAAFEEVKSAVTPLEN